MTQEPTTDKPFFTATEVAEIFGVDIATVSRWLNPRGKNKPKLNGKKSGRDWQIPRAEIKRMVTESDRGAVARWRIKCGGILEVLMSTAGDISRNASLLRYVLESSLGEEPRPLTPKAASLLGGHLAAARRLQEILAVSPIVLQIIAGGAPPVAIATAKRIAELELA